MVSQPVSAGLEFTCSEGLKNGSEGPTKGSKCMKNL